jgi:hypothetical protein
MPHPGVPTHFNEHSTQKYMTVWEILVHNLNKIQQDSSGDYDDSSGDYTGTTKCGSSYSLS